MPLEDCTITITDIATSVSAKAHYVVKLIGVECFIKNESQNRQLPDELANIFWDNYDGKRRENVNSTHLFYLFVVTAK